MPIVIEQSDLDNINRTFARLDELARRGAIKHLADGVHERAIDYADRHTKTGAMFRSIYKMRIDGGYEIGADPAIAPYAIFVHWGTRPHTIEPKDKKALWFTNRGGMFQFAKKIHHPGYAGDPFLTNAIKDELPNFNNWMERQINDL